MKWHFIVFLICTSVMTNDGEHLLMCLLAICISSLEKCLFRSSAHFDFYSIPQTPSPVCLHSPNSYIFIFDNRLKSEFSISTPNWMIDMIASLLLQAKWFLCSFSSLTLATSSPPILQTPQDETFGTFLCPWFILKDEFKRKRTLNVIYST